MTPIEELAINSNGIDWSVFHKRWTRLDDNLKRVAQLIGVSERYIIQRISGKAAFSGDDNILKVCYGVLFTKI